MTDTLLIIEHCEPHLSDWLMLEYRHAATIWKDHTVFTNITNKKDTTTLQKIAHTTTEHANDAYQHHHCLILDPKATQPLTPHDFKGLDAIIIGGILGYKTPRGRTKQLISDHSTFKTRHIGPIQLTIDGAAFIAQAIHLGMNLQDIDIAYEVEITHDPIHHTILPFGYPIINNKPIITPGLIDYLTKNNTETN